MRILITGLVVFVIWSFFSTWLYVDKILPLMKEPVAVPTIPEPKTNVADSLLKLKAIMPETLLIYFGFNEVKFKSDPQIDAGIGEFKKWLAEYQASVLSVTGFTDFIGTSDFNNSLGLKRAEIVQKYLVGKGIQATRIVWDSKGEDQSLGDYFTEEGRARHRRVEISIKN
jgi:OmpA-OmpF porin, OOP family